MVGSPARAEDFRGLGKRRAAAELVPEEAAGVFETQLGFAPGALVPQGTCSPAADFPPLGEPPGEVGGAPRSP